MASMDLKESAQIDTSTTEVTSQVLPEWGGVDGTALDRSFEGEIIPVTGSLGAKTEEIMERDGIHSSWVPTLKQRFGEFTEILPKSINWNKVATVGLAGLMLYEAACAAKPVGADTQPTANATDSLAAQAEESQVGSTNDMGIEEVPEENIYNAVTPTTEEEEKNIPIDFGITPETWEKIYGNDITRNINGFARRHPENLYRIQIWNKENGLKDEYSGKVQIGGNIYRWLGFDYNLNDIDIKIFNKILQGELYIDEEFLEEDNKDVKATVVFMEEVDGEMCFYVDKKGGVGIYIEDGEVTLFPGEIPSSLDERVKQEFTNGNTKVYKNGDEVTGTCSMRW